MKNWLIIRILKWIGNKTAGYKTKVAGTCSILYGLLGAVNLLWPDTTSINMTFEEVSAYVLGGLTALGIGGKLDRLKEVK